MPERKILWEKNILFLFFIPVFYIILNNIMIYS
jgi:hypothetical protein